MHNADINKNRFLNGCCGPVRPKDRSNCNGSGMGALVMGAIILAMLPSRAVAISLVEAGRPTSVIVTADAPSASQRKAAEELQYHVQRMSGATLPIVREQDAAPGASAVILVGQSRRLAALGIDTSAFPPETLLVRTAPGVLILAGEDGGSRRADASYADDSSRTGTLYAVYDFLQDQLGCRWLWPGPTGEVIPRCATVRVDALNVQETPRLFRRHFRGGFAEDVRGKLRRVLPGVSRRQGGTVEGDAGRRNPLAEADAHGPVDADLLWTCLYRLAGQVRQDAPRGLGPAGRRLTGPARQYVSQGVRETLRFQPQGGRVDRGPVCRRAALSRRTCGS